MTQHRFLVRHQTTYTYRRKVRFGPHRFLLHPYDGDGLTVLQASVEVSPEASLLWDSDPFGNQVGHMTIQGRHASLLITSDLDVLHDDSREIPNWVKLSDLSCEGVPTWALPRQAEDRVHHWAVGFPQAGTVRGIVTWMCEWIDDRLRYQRRLELGTQSAAETLIRGIGCCRDFATLMVEGCLTLGIPSRLVSGYLYDAKQDVSPDPVGGDVHAWAQVFIPEVGWCDIDPTHNQVGSTNLLRFAVGPDCSSLPPISGTWVGYPGDAIGMEAHAWVRSIPITGLRGDEAAERSASVQRT